MISYRKFGTAAAATLVAMLTVTAGSAAARDRAHDLGHGGGEGAVYVQTDNLAGNAIAVYDRNPGGTLSAAGTYATGGLGGKLTGSVVDHLASQNSLVYDADAGELFAVNAGSDTISVFDAHGDRLHLRQVIASGGDFPASITVHDDLVYVLNSAGTGSIQGFRLSADGDLRPLAGSWRSLNLDPTLTPQFTSTAGDIAFSPDGRQLLVTTKNNTNSIDVYGIDWTGLPSANPVVTSLPGTVPFAVAFEGRNQVDVAEAGPSAVVSFQLNWDGTLTQLASLSTGAKAACWLVADGPWLFASNAGSASVSSVLSSWSGALSLGVATGTDGGTVDAAASPHGHYIYVQTGANGIVDEFSVGSGGSLTEVGSVTVPNAVGGEGIATS